MIEDVDAATLLRAMSEQERRIVRDAWRDPGPAATDGVLAAVALNRVRKKRPYLWFMAVGWTAYTVVSLVTLPTGGTARLVSAVAVAVLAAGLAAWTWRALARNRRNQARLASVADDDAARERARALRAVR